MFSLVHFSRVFPYIHPYLFPRETAEPSGPAAAASPEGAGGAAQEPGRALVSRAGQTRRLKLLHRRHLRNQRNDALTYSGGLRRAAW